MDVGTRVLADRYELLSPLARGGMGQVWRARDRRLGRAVAIKILRSEFTDEPSFRARFRAEAQHAAMMVHPNIASVFDYGEVPADDTGEPLAYLVMELVEGESLAHLLRREPRLGPELTSSIVRQTAAALAAAHAAGIVHRDVKPGNVLVAPDGTVKITDFGVAWSASSVALTGTGQVIGTAHYLSPEQAQGAKATPASDLYALGAVAYECLAGRRVFDGESSVQVALSHIRDQPDPLPPDVPPDLRALVGRLLAKDPADRYADGASLLAALDRVSLDAGSADTPTAVLPSSPIPGAAVALPAVTSTVTTPVATTAAMDPERTPGRGLVWLVVGAVVAVVALVLGLTLLGGGADPAADTTPTTSAPPSVPSAAPSSSTTPRPSTVPVDAAALVGRPVAEVQAELVALGLAVELVAVPTAELPEGQVTAVRPGGQVPVGAAVGVSYAVAPPPPPEPPAEEAQEEAEEEAEEAEEEAEEAAPGNGNGKGRGKGNGKKDD